MKHSYRFSLFTSFLFVSIAIFGFTDLTESDPLTPVFTPIESVFQEPVTAQSLVASPTPAFVVGQWQPEELPLTAATALPTVVVPPSISMDSLEVEPTVVRTPDTPPTPPHSENLHNFIKQVANQQSQELRGVHVEDVLSLPVVQQPEGDTLYVDTVLGTVTQFQSAARHGVTGLLAHNYLSGDLFFGLKEGQEVNLIYGDGMTSQYLITDIQSYEKLPGTLQNSYYLNLETGEELSTPELFSMMYTGTDKVTFQTCIKKGGDLSWGRIFVIATPLP